MREGRRPVDFSLINRWPRHLMSCSTSLLAATSFPAGPDSQRVANIKNVDAESNQNSARRAGLRGIHGNVPASETPGWRARIASGHEKFSGGRIGLGGAVWRRACGCCKRVARKIRRKCASNSCSEEIARHLRDIGPAQRESFLGALDEQFPDFGAHPGNPASARRRGGGRRTRHRFRHDAAGDSRGRPARCRADADARATRRVRPAAGGGGFRRGGGATERSGSARAVRACRARCVRGLRFRRTRAWTRTARCGCSGCWRI